MQNRFSNNSSEILLYSCQIDWPCELVSVQAEVAAISTRNIFRWAVYRIFEEFADDMPTIHTAAEQLGVMDEVFLKETLEQMTAEGIIEKTDLSKDIDFTNCRLVKKAADQSRQQPKEVHGFTGCFDLITGEHIPGSEGISFDEPANPLLAADKMPQPRENIGLDTARSAAKAQNEPFCGSQSRITDVSVEPQRSEFGYLPVKANILLDENGIIHCCLESQDSSRQRWLDDIDFEHDFFKRLFNSPIEEKYYPCSDSFISFDEFKDNLQQLISADKVISQAVSLISSAKEYVFLDAYWLNFKDIREIIEASNPDLQTTLLARNCQFPEIPETFLASSQITEITDNPRIILLTETTGLSIDRVRVKGISGKNHNVIAASLLKQQSVVNFKNEVSNKPVNV